MTFLSPARPSRLNEVVGFLLFLLGLAVALSLASFSPLDPSWDTANHVVRTQNLMGRVGAWTSDVLLQLFGLSAYLLSLLLWLLGWKWVRSSPFHNPSVRVVGAVALWLSVSSGFGLVPSWRPIPGGIAASGIAGRMIAGFLVSIMNPIGAAIFTTACALLALYLLTTFELSKVARWFAGPVAMWHSLASRFSEWRLRRQERAVNRARQKAEERIARRQGKAKEEADPSSARPRRAAAKPLLPDEDMLPVTHRPAEVSAPWSDVEEPEGEEAEISDDESPFDLDPAGSLTGRSQTHSSKETDADIPILPLAYQPPAKIVSTPTPAVLPAAEMPFDTPVTAVKRKRIYQLPSTDLLNEVPARAGYDGVELKEIAGRIKSKLEEFNVRGSVTQINPGPVVTTFEYKPEAGIKYSRITTLNDDLCLGLQAESVLIERLPGKPTIGIEVPNSRREVISLREILESEEFSEAQSRMTIALGKDINGRIKVAPLETMPHLLIAGSTGSGKSVMLNAMIMSFLFKATPDEVKMIMVDPKRVEMGIYEGIPHLLTPVITEPKKATNALRNAVLEMERRLKLLASFGVRNIDQFNKKVSQRRQQPMNLFDEDVEDEDLSPLPYILIIIDELADLMILERANVEECITRLAQMARAVGMHLVLATQRPSVDVITGLIKANFPSRISFRVATRVDSRTVLDSMGAEHLLGKGDMLFLPPGSSRLTRVHGAFVTEAEANRVVDFWKEQASPEYDETFLQAPPSDDGEGDDSEALDGEQDAMYEDAVRIVLEMGKASTSTLQRRLRLGYGRAARILDMMQRDGIIGPPDGSRPREVLKRPDWFDEQGSVV
jgi:DNA segregation ATPase FtsK/SpoIIIE, S-DNA-T family